MTNTLRFVPFGLAFLASAGDGPLGPTPPGQRLGVIKTDGLLVPITVPAAALLGDTVTVTINTVGNGCSSLGETRVTQDGLSLIIEPFNYWSGPEAVCTDKPRGHRT